MEIVVAARAGRIVLVVVFVLKRFVPERDFIALRTGVFVAERVF